MKSTNPLLILLIIWGGVILWFLLSFLFIPIGRMMWKIIDDARKSMFEEKKEDKK